jgi:uroporphyrinogen decarboxylase
MANTDTMSSKERIKGVMMGQKIDRVPFMPFFVSFMAIDNGARLYDFYTNPEVAFTVGEKTMEKYPWANIRPVHGWGDHGAWEFGGQIVWPEDEESMSPSTPEHLISEPDEIDHLPDPDPENAEWFHLRTQFNDICVQKGYSPSLPSGSIMGQMASIAGATNLMMWMVDNPDAFHRLAKKVMAFNLKMAKITIEKYGAARCSVMTDVALESNTLISAEMFERFCLPYLTQLHKLYFESGVRTTMIHLCGQHKDNLKYWKTMPLPKRTIFSISDVMDLEEAGALLGEDYILAGNISTSTLLQGTREEIIKETKRCCDQAKGRPGGFILMPACEFPPRASRENLDAVREGVMEYGRY